MTAAILQRHLVRSRSSGLDLLKWLAMATMLLDHLRYIWPQAGGLLVLGRLAFPLYCLAIAANVARSPAGELFTPANGRYLGWLLVFAVLSEWPYQLYSSNEDSFNVLPTLALGLVIAWGAHHKTRLSGGMAIAAAVLAYFLNAALMYGFIGALIPAALLIAIQRPGILWLVPAALCLVVNMPSHILAGAAQFQLYALSFLGSAFLAPIFGLWLLRQNMSVQVWPVGRWGYWFYPGHLLVLHLVRKML